MSFSSISKIVRSSRCYGLELFILLVWLFIVIYTSSKHEPYRDEVRAISIVRDASSIADLFVKVQYDGHPILWYLLLYWGSQLYNSYFLLTISSIVVAFLAVAFFLFKSPFPFWYRSAFIFTALPAYEYSVMCRNYGISMLLFFLSADNFSSALRRPIFFGSILFLAANTNVHSTLLTCLFALLWVFKIVLSHSKTDRDRYFPHTLFGLGLVLAGGLLSLVSTYPRENAILTGFGRTLTLEQLWASAANVIFNPGDVFVNLIPFNFSPWVCSLVIYGLLLGLLPRYTLCFFGWLALILLGVFFREIYPGGYRHQGLVLIFILCLYWVLNKEQVREIKANRWLGFSKLLFYFSLSFLLASELTKTFNLVVEDIQKQRTSSSPLADFLSSNIIYKNAILVPEPDYFLESLPYYIDNSIYFPREERFGAFVSWTTSARVKLSIGELLAAAKKLKAERSVPVIILLGHSNLNFQSAGELRFSYNKIFSWTPEDVKEFNNSVLKIAEFSEAYSDENFIAFSLID